MPKIENYLNHKRIIFYLPTKNYTGLLEQMRAIPSQLPGLTIYDTAAGQPRHFIENLSVYARQLQVPVTDLLMGARSDSVLSELWVELVYLMKLWES